MVPARGIISAALIDPDLASCDTKAFAVFTDVTQFDIWVQSYVYQYG